MGKFVHGMVGTPAYDTWRAMIQRCTNPRCPAYPRYGGAGITVYPEWLTFTGFYRDMGDPPPGKRTIDRIDNTRGYEPGNCRWASYAENNANRRNTAYLTVEGRTKPIAEWARENGVSVKLVHQRLKKGWSPERAIMPSGTALLGVALDTYSE